MRVTLENLTKHFGQVVAVEDVSLEIEEAEFVALLGPSGCGKTTTLLMIAGIYKPTQGYVHFDDRVVNDLPPKDRNVGMVFQSYALYPHMSVFDNIAFPLKLQKVSGGEIKRRVQRVTDMMRIEELMDRKPAQLSGGQQQRVAICRALVKEPDLLLFDEPLSNLDAKLRLRMRGELKRLQMELGITSIYVTHDQVEAMTMADRIAVMDQGLLQAYGPPEQLYDHPETMFVAAFIGSPPMSFISVTFEESDGRFYLRRKGLNLRLPDERARLAKLNRAPKEVMMGIRPEDITIGAEGDVKAEVYVIEPLGREDLVTFRLEDEEVCVLTPAPFGGQIGEVMSLSLNKGKIHLFNPATEESLLRKDCGGNRDEAETLRMDFKRFERLGIITPYDADERDVVLFPERIQGRHAAIHRPGNWIGPGYPVERPSIWFAFLDGLPGKTYDHKVIMQPEYPWEARKIGAGPPPIKTEAGWLLIYHGVDPHHVYRAGAALLDLEEPWRVIARTPEPILEPKEEYERQGDVPNVVFPEGAVVVSDQILVFYGAADRVCCVASVRLNELVDDLLEGRKGP